MNKSILIWGNCLSLLISINVLADPGSVTILMPSDDVTVSSDQDRKLKFPAEDAFEGLARLEYAPVTPLVLLYDTNLNEDHGYLSLTVDGKQLRTVREFTSSRVSVDPQPRGPHVACLEMMNQDGTPTGRKSCVRFLAK